MAIHGDHRPFSARNSRIALRRFSSARSGVDREAGVEKAPAAGSPTSASTVQNSVAPIRLLVVVGCAIVAAIALATVILISKFHERALTESERELKNTALILAEQTDRTFQALELVQIGVIEYIRSLGITSREDFARRMSSYDVHLMLGQRIGGLPQVDDLILLDSNGDLVNFSRHWPIPAINALDRDYFIALKSSPGLTSFVGEPEQNRGSGTWSIYLARKLVAPDGEFLGLILGAMDLQYFEKLFASIVLGPQSSISLQRSDGMVLARFPRIGATAGRTFTGMIDALGERESGTVRSIGRMDGKDRLLAAHRLAHFPLFVTVGADIDAILAEWRNGLKFVMGAGGLAAIAIAATFLVIAHQMLQRNRWSRRRLQQQKMQLDSALNNMSQGLLMFDSAERVIVCNRRYIEMYGLSPAVVRPGCTFRELIAHRKEKGNFIGDFEQYRSDLRRDLARGTTSDLVVEIANGRSIRIVNQPMENGGWLATHEDITDKVRAEAALRESEARFADLFEFSPDALVLYDQAGVIQLVNSETKRMFGYLSDDLAGRSIEILIPEYLADQRGPMRSRRTAPSAGRRAAGATGAMQQELLARRSDGSDFPADIMVSPIMTNGHRMFCAAIRDVTDRRRLEEERSQHQEFLNQIVDNVPVAIIVKDASEQRFILVNRATEELWGMPREQAIGKTPHDLFPKERADLITADDDKVLQSDTPLFVDQHQNLADADDDRILTSRKLAIRGVNGRPKYIVSVIEDVTERRRAERERDRNREFLDMIVENVPSTIVVKDARDLRYVLINRAGEEYFGVPRSEMIGKTAYDVLPGEAADFLTGLDRQILESPRTPVVNEHTIETPGHGVRIGLSKRLGIFDDDGKAQYILVVVDDVTDRKATERQLQQAQKMEAVGNLTGGLAHDFNNLLMVIIGNLDLLQEHVADRPDAAHKVEIILQASLRGADLTRQLLAFSRQQSLQPKRVDVNRLIGNTARLLTRTLGEDIRIDLRNGVDLCPVLVDEAQLEAALVNIAINARDAMPGGGTLIISARNVHLDADYSTQHPEVAPGDYVCIEVSDTGTGMPPEVLARIFEPFFTTKTPGKGTGLGLSMVYGFIKQSGGHVIAYSEVGKGTTFKLCLPRAIPEDARSDIGRVAPEPTPPAHGEVILAVDDNPDVLATAVNHLKNIGYQVLEADGVGTALEKLNGAGKVDLLFTDMIMPGGMSGKELARAAREKRPSLKVLFTSGFPGAALSAGAELDAGEALLSKPYRKHDLAEAVREILHKP